MSNEIERGNAIVIASHSFAIDDAGARTQAGQRINVESLAAKVTRDHSDVETPQDRLLGLAIKQEFERRLDATLRRVRACRQSLASVSHHRHMMASLAVSHRDDDREFKWITFAGSLDLDHSYLHRNRCSRSAFSVPKRAAADGPISPVLRTP